jgi:hypothetical protein
MEREIHLDKDVSINYSRNKLPSMDKVKTYLDSLGFIPYWYQGYAFRGKQLIMRLRQTMLWFSELECPYANNNLPANALRFTCLPPLKFPNELNELKTQMEQKFGQKFNSLLVEKFDSKDSRNAQPFVTSMFCKEKESWVESNTKICIIPVGEFSPEKCNWMTKVVIESESKKKPGKISKKLKFVPKKKMKFKNRILALNIEHSTEWKIQMPTVKSNDASPFYLLTFRCIDGNKALSHLRHYHSLQPLMTPEQLHECIVRKTLLTKEDKEYYIKLAKDYIYTQKTQKKKGKDKKRRAKSGVNNDNGLLNNDNGLLNNDNGLLNNDNGLLNNDNGDVNDGVIISEDNSINVKAEENMIPCFQVSKKRKIIEENELIPTKTDATKCNSEQDEDMIVFEFLNN